MSKPQSGQSFNYGIPTLDSNPKKLFKLYQEQGVIPEQYKSWDQLEKDFAQRVKSGVTEKQARIDMGMDYRNIDGQYLLQKNMASDGAPRYLNKRAIRTDLNPKSALLIEKHAGSEALDAYKKKIKQDWNVFARDEAQALGKATGKQFHRGHVVAALEGGGLTMENMMPEHGKRNVLHGSAPRIPMDAVHNNGIAPNDLQAYYNDLLDKEGLGIARPNNALMIAADEHMVQPVGGEAYTKNVEAGIDPATLEMKQARLNELEQQGVSRQAIENWSMDQSSTLSRGDSVKQSGPVKVVQPAKQKVNVVSPGAKKAQPQYLPRKVVDAAVEMGVPQSYFPNRLMSPRVAGVLGATPGLLGAIFDGVALADAIQSPKKTNRQQLAAALNGVSGASGLAMLASGPAAPLVGAVSMGTGLAATAVETKADKKAVEALKKVEQTKRSIDPIRAPKDKAYSALQSLFIGK